MSDARQEILSRLHQLPTLPVVVQEVIASFQDAGLDTASLAYKITQDQGLSAKVLRVANSSFYGLSRKVSSIQEAVVVLGFDTVRSLVLSAGMMKVFPIASGSLFDRQAYWQHSFRIATIAKALAKHFQQGQQLAFTSGLFCEVGQLLLDLCIPQQFSAVLQRHADSGLSLLEFERAELGFDHAEMGAELIRLWNFPQEIEQVVRGWQQPEQSPKFNSLICLVYMAASVENGASLEDMKSGLGETACSQMAAKWELLAAAIPSAGQLEQAASLALHN